MTNPRLEVLTPQNCQLIFIDHLPQMAFGVQERCHASAFQARTDPDERAVHDTRVPACRGPADHPAGLQPFHAEAQEPPAMPDWAPVRALGGYQPRRGAFGCPCRAF